MSMMLTSRLPSNDYRGVIHAWWLVSKYPDSDYHQTQGQAYHAVQPAQQPYPPAQPVHQQPYPGQQPGYAAPNKY